MLKIQIKWKWIGEQEEKQFFSVFLKTTDGMQLIFESMSLWDVAQRIKLIQTAIPSITDDDVEFI